jgi:hypothetical protein
MGNFDKSYPDANEPDSKSSRKGYGDDGGTRVGKPDSGKETGAGQEATRSTGGTAKGHDVERSSEYGGDGVDELKK